MSLDRLRTIALTVSAPVWCTALVLGLIVLVTAEWIAEGCPEQEYPLVVYQYILPPPALPL